MRSAALLFFLFLAPLASRASGEDAVLNELNLARTHPREYADILLTRMQSMHGISGRSVLEAVAFLQRQRPLEPLQCAPGLVMSARDQVADQGLTGETGHRGANGSSPWSRMSRWGQWTGRAGENISYGYNDARTIVATLIVDQGVPDRGHRRNIFCREFKVAGAARGSHPQYGAMCVIDFAGGFLAKGEKVAMAEPWRGIGE
jgi:uncharacterized protein YkwD